jgi:integrase
MSDADVMASFELHMMTAKLSPVTIEDRLQLIARLAKWLPRGLLDATPGELERFQQAFANLSRSTIDIYTRHARAFYRWALVAGLVSADPCVRMVDVKPRRGVPHPIAERDLRLVLACAPHALRTTYVLAAFAGLRAGEITRLRGEDLRLDTHQPTAIIDGKGGRERVVPLLPPVVEELHKLGFPRAGHVVMQTVKPVGSSVEIARPYSPNLLSIASSKFMQSVGVESTLHSLRHYFATEVVRLTRDILLVRDLLGHSSVATTQIYMASSIDGAQDRLASFASNAAELLANR